MDSTENKQDSEHEAPFQAEKPVERAQRCFIMWENQGSTSWIDASLAIIVHNKTIQNNLIPSAYMSTISGIVRKFNGAVDILNSSDNDFEHRLKKARKILWKIQKNVCDHLQPMTICTVKKPQAAFSVIHDLFKREAAISQLFEVTWSSTVHCIYCGKDTITEKTESIITLQKVAKFDPAKPSTMFVCSCENEQEMFLHYNNFSTGFIFYFTDGGGIKAPPMNFTTGQSRYQLTAIMTLEKGTDNHFITWIRDIYNDKWLECNDLNNCITYYSSDPPEINLANVYMYIFELFPEFDSKPTPESTKETASLNAGEPCLNISEECKVGLKTTACNSAKIVFTGHSKQLIFKNPSEYFQNLASKHCTRGHCPRCNANQRKYSETITSEIDEN